MLIQRTILVAATKALAKLVISCILGYVFTKRGMITQNALTVLSRLVYKIFLPCLLFANVTRTIASTNQSIEKLVVITASSVLRIFFGIAIGQVTERIICIEPGSSDSRELRVCTAFGNIGTLPLLFMDAIFGNAGNEEALSITVTYISFSILGWSLVFWTKGYLMLTGHPQRAPVLQAPESDSEQPSSSSPLIKKETPAFQRKVVDGFWRIVEHPSTEKILSPPVLGCLAGVVVGSCPGTDSLLTSRDAPFFPLLDAIQGLGSALIPLALLVLAGSLASQQDGPDPTAEGSSWRSGVFYRKVAAIMVSRFLIMPFLSAGLLLAGFRAGIIHYEKLLWFVLLMEGFMPSAQTSVIVLQMEGKPELAASMAKTLTAVYILSAVPMAVLTSAALEFADKAEGMQ